MKQGAVSVSGFYLPSKCNSPQRRPIISNTSTGYIWLSPQPDISWTQFLLPSSLPSSGVSAEWTRRFLLCPLLCRLPAGLRFHRLCSAGDEGKITARNHLWVWQAEFPRPPEASGLLPAWGNPPLDSLVGQTTPAPSSHLPVGGALGPKR